jgi:hypothetical protein
MFAPTSIEDFQPGLYVARPIVIPPIRTISNLQDWPPTALEQTPTLACCQACLPHRALPADELALRPRESRKLAGSLFVCRSFVLQSQSLMPFCNRFVWKSVEMFILRICMHIDPRSL